MLSSAIAWGIEAALRFVLASMASSQDRRL
jgi:hypothetical protein